MSIEVCDMDEREVGRKWIFVSILYIDSDRTLTWKSRDRIDTTGSKYQWAQAMIKTGKFQ